MATARIHPLFAPRALAVAGVAAAALLAAPAGAQKGGGGGGDTPASLGPLAPHVALSPAGRPWIATVGTDGALLVENTTDPAGITLHRMPSAGARPTSVSVRVVVAAATAEPPPPGLRSGAGLLYGVQGSGPEVFFYALLVEPDGTVSLLRRSAAEGVQPVLSQRIAGGGGEGARQAELRIVETAAGGAEFHLDGRRFATLRSQGIGEGSVGVVAFGVGRYAFRDFRLGSAGGTGTAGGGTGGPAKPLGAPAGPAAPDAASAKPPPAGAPARPASGRGAEAAPPAGGGASPAAARLVPHRDPAGFALERPEGWTVEAPAPTQVAVWDPGGRTGALIRGRAARGELTQWLAHAYPATEGVGDAVPLSVEAVGPDAARAAFRFTGPDGRPRRANAVAVRRGEVATVFAAVAPEEEFAGALPVLSAVLDSFRLGTAPPSDAAPPAVPPMVRWIDPVERAFTVDVPRDWRVSGGLHRRGGPATQGRATFTVASPDGGRILLFVGDPAVPAFVVPSPTILSLGHREGQPVSPGGPVLMRFRHAAEIGPELLQRRFGAVEVTDRRDRPDISEHRRRNQPVTQGSVGLMSAGDLEFRLPDGRRGAATLTTAGYDVPGLVGGWTVEEAYGFVAPPEAVGLAGATLARVLGSFAVNPAWFANETRMASVDSGRWLEYLRGSAALQQRTLEQRWAAQDARAAARGDVLSGTVRLVDPRTGDAFTAPAGSRFFYRVVPDPHRPTVVGVDVDANPEPRIEMRRLLQMGVDIPYR